MKVLKFFKFIIILVILAVIIYALYFILSYQLNKNKYTTVAEIQGKINGYVPQGLAYSDKYDIILQTSYNTENNNSKLFIIDFKTGKCLKELLLNKSDGLKNTSHVGGITTNDELVWITSDYEVNEYSLDEIVETKKNNIDSINDIKIKNRGDFCTYDNNILWVGEFALKEEDNPILNGYKIKENINVDYDKPGYTYKLPLKVQGMAVTEDGKFLYSRSFSGLVKSDLSLYDEEKKISNKKIPSMSEGIFIKDNEVYVLFESSADTYVVVYPRMNNIIKLDL